MSISFSLNAYDEDGEMYERGIFIHLGNNNIIIKLKDKEELSNIIRELLKVQEEINEIA